MNRTQTNSSPLPSNRSWIPWSTHNQAVKQAVPKVRELKQDKPKDLVQVRVPVLDKDPAQALDQVPVLDKDPAQALDQVPVKAPEKAQAKDLEKVLAKAHSQALEKVPEQDTEKLAKTHIPTSFIPEMEQLNMVA